MPSIQHEGLVEMFRQRPELAAWVLRGGFGLRLPPYRNIRVESPDLSEPVPLERRADAVVAFTDGAGRPVLAVVVEVQLRSSKEKRWSWPHYLAKLRARLTCPVMLLVVTPTVATAEACAVEIEMGHPGWVLCPLVCGPRQVPVVTDIGQSAEMPEVAMLSAMMHGSRPEYAKILDTLQVALAATDQDRAVQYAEIVFAVLPTAARRYWEELMSTGTFQFQSAYARRLRAEGEARGRAQGRAEGRAEGEASGRATGRAEGEARLVLAVLGARGFDVPEEVRARITGCTDPDQLEAWGRRAAVIRTIDDLFN